MCNRVSFLSGTSTHSTHTHTHIVHAVTIFRCHRMRRQRAVQNGSILSVLRWILCFCTAGIACVLIAHGFPSVPLPLPLLPLSLSLSRSVASVFLWLWWKVIWFSGNLVLPFCCATVCVRERVYVEGGWRQTQWRKVIIFRQWLLSLYFKWGFKLRCAWSTHPTHDRWINERTNDGHHRAPTEQNTNDSPHPFHSMDMVCPGLSWMTHKTSTQPPRRVSPSMSKNSSIAITPNLIFHGWTPVENNMESLT